MPGPLPRSTRNLFLALLVLSIFPLSWVLDSLSAHAAGLILAAYGAAVLWFGLVAALRVGLVLRRGIPTQGTVVGAEQETDQGHDGASYTAHHPVVQFTTADGRTVEFTAGVGYKRKPDIGSAMPVRYHRDDPEQAEVERAITWMLDAALWLLVGLGLLVAALFMYLEAPQDLPAVG